MASEANTLDTPIPCEFPICRDREATRLCDVCDMARCDSCVCGEARHRRYLMDSSGGVSRPKEGMSRPKEEQFVWCDENCHVGSDHPPAGGRATYTAMRWSWLATDYERRTRDLRVLWRRLKMGWPLSPRVDHAGSHDPSEPFPLVHIVRSILHVLDHAWERENTLDWIQPMDKHVWVNTLRLVASHKDAHTIDKRTFLRCLGAPVVRSAPIQAALRADAFHHEWLHEIDARLAADLLEIQSSPHLVFTNLSMLDAQIADRKYLNDIAMALPTASTSRWCAVNDRFAIWPPGLVDLIMSWDLCYSVPIRIDFSI